MDDLDPAPDALDAEPGTRIPDALDAEPVTRIRHTRAMAGNPPRSLLQTSPLISAVDLAARIRKAGGPGEPAALGVRVVDVRWVLGQPGEGRRRYGAGHLPGAIFLDLDGDLAVPPGPGLPGRHPLPSPAAFAATLTRVGISPNDLVVAYDDVGGWVAARLWWMLDDLGHRGGEAVLDGGIQAWVASGGELTTDDGPTTDDDEHTTDEGPTTDDDEHTTDGDEPTTTQSAEVPQTPGSLKLAGRWTNVIELDTLRDRLGEVTLLDARGAPRYRGEVEPIDPYPGHIPTAVSAPTDGNLSEPNGRFLPPAALRGRFEWLTAAAIAAGAAAPGTPVVTSCGSGVSATHHAVAMRLAGLPDPILYVGSYSEWSRAGQPVAIGPEPGPPPMARRNHGGRHLGRRAAGKRRVSDG